MDGSPLELVFVLSLPRSGSTLCQRILASHKDVSTAAEPTFLLPLLHLARTGDVFATYDQMYTSWAIEDFVSSLPGGEDDLHTATRRFADSLYRSAAEEGSKYFIDKTPKYHFVANDIIELFPTARVILLWRNPLAVVASLMSTWGGEGGKWNLQHFRIDLFEGVEHLVQVAQAHTDRVCTVRYEDLVAEPTTTAEKMFKYLDLEFDPTVLTRFSELRLEGRVQDPNVASREFSQVRSDRVEQWRSVLSNPLRKRWCRRYLDWIGAERLAVMGYDLGELQRELASIPTSMRFLVSDLYRRPYDAAYRAFELRLVKAKIDERRRGRQMYAHK
jgi:hypothetical protein